MSNNKEKIRLRQLPGQGSILAAAGIIVRFIGLLYKIPMTRAIGDEGIGYYNTAYEIYNIGLILSSYSLPLAISRSRAARARKKPGCAAGLSGRTALWSCSRRPDDTVFTVWRGLDHGSYLQQPQQRPSTKGYGTDHSGVFSVMGVVRGYFQGLGNMVPTSISQVIEQVVNAIISVAASFTFMHWFANRETPAAYGAAGGTSGYPFRRAGCLRVPGSSDVFIPQTKTKALHRPQADRLESWNHVYTALFLTLTPIILSQFVYQLSGSVDNSMFGFLMSGKGLTEKERLSLLGIYGGKYRLLSNVPVAVASSLGTSMIPSIVRSRAQKNHTDVMYKIRLTIKFNMLIAIPCAFGMAALASPVLRLIFRDSRDLTRNLLMLGAQPLSSSPSLPLPMRCFRALT